MRNVIKVLVVGFACMGGVAANAADVVYGCGRGGDYVLLPQDYDTQAVVPSCCFASSKDAPPEECYTVTSVSSGNPAAKQGRGWWLPVKQSAWSSAMSGAYLQCASNNPADCNLMKAHCVNNGGIANIRDGKTSYGCYGATYSVENCIQCAKNYYGVGG